MIPVLYTEAHRLHEPGFFFKAGAMGEAQEKRERADELLAAVKAAGYPTPVPEQLGIAPIAAIHTPDYLCFLEEAYEIWRQIPAAGPEVVPNVFAVPGMTHGYPTRIVGRAGYHMQDLASPMGEGTYVAAMAAANLAADAARRVAAGEHAAYALCRPPGHHAYADRAGGVCYLNNAAIAAQYLLRTARRVAIVDIDVHHGNGTQGVFYQRSDVFFVSLHRDPVDYHPYFCGYAQERGEGAGLGYNLNLPLPAGTGDDQYLDALDFGLRRVEKFAADALVVSLGLDAHEHDPFQGLRITTDGFARIAARLAALKLPSVLVQEGGYDRANIGANLLSFFRGFAG